MSRVIRCLQSPIVRFAVLALLLAFVTALDASKASFAAEPNATGIPTASPERSIPAVTAPAKSQVIDWFQGKLQPSMPNSHFDYSHFRYYLAFLLYSAQSNLLDSRLGL